MRKDNSGLCNGDEVRRFYSKNSVRMCVVCRDRFLQQELIRLQYIESKLALYNGSGRSFYICNECIDKPKTSHIVKRYIKHTDSIDDKLKEIAQIWQLSKK